MRTLEEIDRDIAIAREDARRMCHFSPVLEDDIDELHDERAAVVKAMESLKQYDVLILPKPDNTSSLCAACYKLCAKNDAQAFELGEAAFAKECARYGVTAEDFDAEYDIAITSGENVK
jgi:hypothetical protein